MKASQPNVCLLSNGRIEIPGLSIFPKQLGIYSWVAITLAKQIFCRVFAVKVKNINGEANVFEKGVSLDMSSERTVVIKKEVIRLLTTDCKRALDKLLYRTKQLKPSWSQDK